MSSDQTRLDQYECHMKLQNFQFLPLITPYEYCQLQREWINLVCQCPFISPCQQCIYTYQPASEVLYTCARTIATPVQHLKIALFPSPTYVASSQFKLKRSESLRTRLHVHLRSIPKYMYSHMRLFSLFTMPWCVYVQCNLVWQCLWLALHVCIVR